MYSLKTRFKKIFKEFSKHSQGIHTKMCPLADSTT